MSPTSPPPPSGPLAEARVLLGLAGPIALAQIGLVALGLVDTALLGRVSTAALAGASLGRSLLFAVSAFSIGVAGALEPLVAQALGAGERQRAWSALGTGVRACLLMSLPIVGLAFAASSLLPLLGVAEELRAPCRQVLLGSSVGVPGFGLFLVAKAYLQALGKTRPALWATGLVNVLNLGVGSVLVLGDEALRWVHLPPLGLRPLGALGAGLATSLAHTLLALVLLVAAWLERPRALAPEAPPETVPLRKVLALGLPIGAQMLAEIGVFSLAALLAGRLGPQAASAHQVALGLASLTFMGALGVAAATSVHVGQAVGAGLPARRVGLIGMGLGAAVMGLGGVVFALFPHWLASLFSTDPEVVSLGASLLRIAAVFQLVDGLQAVAGGALRGAGDVGFPFLATLASHWLVGLPLCLLLGFGLGWGVQGVWWGLTGGLVVIALLLGKRFLKVSSGNVERV